MRELFNFIQKNLHWLLFLILFFLSGTLIIKNHQFQRSKYLTVAHEVTGKIYSVTNSVYSYINLKEDNGILLNKIAELETENYLYRKKIEELESSEQTGRIEIDSVNFLNYRFIPARIAYNTISGPENYLLLNRGSNHGIAPDMGVMSPNGIVGVVVGVSSHYSLVISVLNPSFQLNCKLKNKNYSGPLVWDGKDFRYTYLENLPRHAEIEVNDTVMTSGYSAFFPEGLPVGIVSGSRKQKNDSYNSAQVKLFTDFSTLSEVIVVKNSFREEQIDLLKIVRK